VCGYFASSEVPEYPAHRPACGRNAGFASLAVTGVSQRVFSTNHPRSIPLDRHHPTTGRDLFLLRHGCASKYLSSERRPAMREQGARSGHSRYRYQVLEALNLTNQFQYQYVDTNGNRMNFYHQQGRDYLVGARYKF
jgi:hypothetical protein